MWQDSIRAVMKLKNRTVIGLMVVFIMCLWSCTNTKDKPTPEQVAGTLAQTLSGGDKELYDEFIAIQAPAGEQLPPPSTDVTGWQQVKIGHVSMLIPPDWKVASRDENKESRISTLGVISPKEDLYVELREIQDSDSSYGQTAMDHAKSDYALSKGRYAEKTILGFQPMVKAGVVGKAEIMNEYGREKNEDGSLTLRLILWDGRWLKDNSITKADLVARFAQNRYEEFAPIVSDMIASIKINP